jgi:hypothetical protein
MKMCITCPGKMEDLFKVNLVQILLALESCVRLLSRRMIKLECDSADTGTALNPETRGSLQDEVEVFMYANILTDTLVPLMSRQRQDPQNPFSSVVRYLLKHLRRQYSGREPYRMSAIL